tara:strand:- start:644 stop:1504 length:861 start_codon:yes stop_codon:yes gene_type:complete
MNKNHSFLVLLLVVLSFILLGFYSQNNNEDDTTGKLKIVLRQVGNELLLSNKDSSSLILPIKKVSKSKYQISFEKPLSFEPSKLVEIVKSNFKKASLDRNYRVEVIQCLDDEVAYSYEINIDEEKTLVPCLDRVLPISCYTVQVQFLGKRNSRSNILYYIFIPLILGIFYILFFKNKENKKPVDSLSEKHKTLGSFLFYPEQSKIVQKSKEITLSNKECELLEIFISKINQVVKREELTKRVWEDNGVIVGRSLDTYISKLRKKLQDDPNIKLINIHGVGYKLEIK